MTKVKFEIELILAIGHRTLRVIYRQDPLQYLIEECDRNARRVRELMHDEERTNVKYCRDYVLKKGSQVISRLMKEAIMIIDSKETECKHT